MGIPHSTRKCKAGARMNHTNEIDLQIWLRLQQGNGFFQRPKLEAENSQSTPIIHSMAGVPICIHTVWRGRFRSTSKSRQGKLAGNYSLIFNETFGHTACSLMRPLGQGDVTWKVHARILNHSEKQTFINRHCCCGGRGVGSACIAQEMLVSSIPGTEAIVC